MQNEKEYYYRRNCEVVRDILSRYDKDEFPERIYNSLDNLIDVLEKYISDGFSYAIVRDEKGDIDFKYSSPDLEKGD